MVDAGNFDSASSWYGGDTPSMLMQSDGDDWIRQKPSSGATSDSYSRNVVAAGEVVRMTVDLKLGTINWAEDTTDRHLLTITYPAITSGIWWPAAITSGQGTANIEIM